MGASPVRVELNVPVVSVFPSCVLLFDVVGNGLVPHTCPYWVSSSVLPILITFPVTCACDDEMDDTVPVSTVGS